MKHTLVLLLLCLGWPEMSDGHGRLVEPPSRSSMWRFGFKTPPNYNDNELFCGGYTVQWKRHGGKCGVCGDPWHAPQPRPNEAGGTYGKGIIVRRYTQGQGMTTTVELTANHQGFFEFKLCPHNNPNLVVQQECLDSYPLTVEGTSETRYYVPDNDPRRFEVRLKLPEDVTCTQCVFQWTYTAGNNWGTCEDGSGKVGCGPQETFRGCADVAIDGDSNHDDPAETSHHPTGFAIRPGGGYVNETELTTTTISFRPFSKKPTKVPYTWSTRPAYKPTPSYQPTPKTVYTRPTLRPSSTFKTTTRSPVTKSSYWATTKSPFGKSSYRPSFKPSFGKGTSRPWSKQTTVYSTTPRPYYSTTGRPSITKIPPKKSTGYFTKFYSSTTPRPSISKIPPKKVSSSEVENGNSVEDHDRSQKCKGVGVWKRLPGIDGWCDVNCGRGYCPSTHCLCG